MTANTATAPALEAGAAVVGIYMGVPFEARIDSTRGHTINWNLRLTFVTLTAPMAGEFATRDSLCLTTNYDGTSYRDSRGFDSECSLTAVAG